MKRTGTTNEYMQTLILDLKREGSLHKSALWKTLASELSKPTRIRSVVNVSRINRFTAENEVVVVPGKVLGSGTVDHSVTVAAFSFSESAKKRIEEAKGKYLTIYELLQSNPEGKKVRLMK